MCNDGVFIILFCFASIYPHHYYTVLQLNINFPSIKTYHLRYFLPIMLGYVSIDALFDFPRVYSEMRKISTTKNGVNVWEFSN